MRVGEVQEGTNEIRYSSAAACSVQLGILLCYSLLLLLLL